MSSGGCGKRVEPVRTDVRDEDVAESRTGGGECSPTAMAVAAPVLRSWVSIWKLEAVRVGVGVLLEPQVVEEMTQQIPNPAAQDPEEAPPLLVHSEEV